MQQNPCFSSSLRWSNDPSIRAPWGLVLLVFAVGCAAATLGPSTDGDSAASNVATAVSPCPRPIAPLSTATVTSQTPILRWALAMASDGARVQICHDRACAVLEQTLDVTGTQIMVPTALKAGVHFWRLGPRVGTTVSTTWSPTWEFFVGHRSAPIDASWGTIADINGDGFADVVVGDGHSNTAYMYLGSANGLSATCVALTGPVGSTDFGWSVASAGDVNGDGFADVVVGTFGSNAAYVYLGSASGLRVTSITLTGPAGTTAFGWSVASAGDVNGDGFADVIVGNPPNTAYVYLGSASGLTATPLTLTGPAGSTEFGDSVASVGDVNGDGFADVVVGTFGPSNTAYVYLGCASGLTATPIALNGSVGFQGFGDSVASAGDVNGDGFADVVVGDTMSNAASVYLGSASGLTVTPTTLTGPTGSNFGNSVASAGDVNGDGFADVVVGAEGSNSVSVYLGSASGLTVTPITLTRPAGSNDFGFGESVASAGDVDGDGFVDVVVGDWDSNTAYVFLGSASGLRGDPITLTSPVGSDIGFGDSVASAGGVNGDGFADRVVGNLAARSPWRIQHELAKMLNRHT